MAGILVFAVASCVLLAASVSSAPSTPVVYSVGDERGWTVPSGNGTETYNHWAKRNRFLVGDVLDFKYANDSVLLVNHDDYKQCSTASPVSRFTDGDTKFKFDRYGLFYFISGVPGHCEVGQRMIVRVMAQSALADAPAAAAAVSPSVSGASSPVAAPGTPSSSGSSSSPSPQTQASGASSPVAAPGTPSSSGSSSSPSPQTQASGASRRVLAGFSIAVGHLVCAITVLLLV